MNIKEEELDFLKELINIGMGRGANSLNSLLSTHVDLNAPLVRVLNLGEVEKAMAGNSHGKLASVSIRFRGEAAGDTILAFPQESAAKLVSLLTESGSSEMDMDSLKEGALTEIGNIILNGVMGSFANMLKRHLTFTIPSYREGTLKDLLPGKYSEDGHVIVMVLTNFKVKEHLIEGNIYILFEIDSLHKMLAHAVNN